MQDFGQVGVPDLDKIDEIVLNKSLKYCQQLITDIQKRFRSKYLGLWIQRNGNKKQKWDIKLGEVVLIGNNNVKCNDLAFKCCY